MLAKAAIVFLLVNILNVPLAFDDVFLPKLVQTKHISTQAPERINFNNLGVQVSAQRFIVVDVASGQVLLSKNPADRQAIASVTKLMTAVVILERNPDWQNMVQMQKQDETIGAQPHVYRGESIKFYDLWKTALIASDNNAIKAMIRSLGLSEEDFVGLMNEKARELGLADTKFADPTGLNINNLSSAFDVSKLVHYSLQHNEIRETVLQFKYEFEVPPKKDRRILNTDVLLESFLNNPKYEYELIGGKTGYLIESGFCLAVEVAKNGHPIIIAVLNSDSIESRFTDVKVIADWVFTNYVWK